MSSDSVLNEDTKSTGLPADVKDDSFIVKYIEIVPLARDTEGSCTTECDGEDWSAQVRQENLPVVKKEPQDVCCLDFMCKQCISNVTKNELNGHLSLQCNSWHTGQI